jgi:hypothetical protein
VARIQKKEANKKIKEANRKHQQNSIGGLNKQVRGTCSAMEMDNEVNVGSHLLLGNIIG